MKQGGGMRVADHKLISAVSKDAAFFVKTGLNNIPSESKTKLTTPTEM
jgi:hypothetical protein